MPVILLALGALAIMLLSRGRSPTGSGSSSPIDPGMPPALAHAVATALREERNHQTLADFAAALDANGYHQSARALRGKR